MRAGRPRDPGTSCRASLLRSPVRHLEPFEPRRGRVVLDVDQGVDQIAGAGGLTGSRPGAHPGSA